MPKHKLKNVKIVTDGGCSPNPGLGTWAYIISYKSKKKEVVGTEPNSTNNRMEMMAAIKALESLKEPCAVYITTDSQYLLQGITSWIKKWKKNNWKLGKGKHNRKDVKNVDLWQRLDELCAIHEVTWEWVKGHNGHVGNERVDELASLARLNRQFVLESR